MREASESPDRLRDRNAERALETCTEDFRELLVKMAAERAAGSAITSDDVHWAFDRLGIYSDDSLQFADAQAVISQALKENRVVEWVSYAMALILFVFGLVLLSVGTWNSDVATRVACLVSGSIVELLILVPLRFAINSRRHNIALRMLGLIINRVDDPKKLAPLLKDTFLAVIVGESHIGAAKER